MKRNNLNLAVLAGVVQRGAVDPDAFKMHKRVEGAWSFTDATPAYSAPMAHGDRTTVLSVDVAPGFGGAGLAPDPLQYMLTGLGACFAATVVAVAALEGVDLSELSVVTEQDVDVARVYDMGDGPLMEQITVTVRVVTDVDDQTLARWEQTARAKCPFAFTVINAVPLHTVIQRA